LQNYNITDNIGEKKEVAMRTFPMLLIIPSISNRLGEFILPLIVSG